MGSSCQASISAAHLDPWATRPQVKLWSDALQTSSAIPSDNQSDTAAVNLLAEWQRKTHVRCPCSLPIFSLPMQPAHFQPAATACPATAVLHHRSASLSC